MKAKFVIATPNILETIEQAARTCYKSENLIKTGSAEKIFNTVIKQRGHESCCEHASITMKLTIDRATMTQLIRSRIGFSYSCESQRYCNYSKDKFENQVSFIKPMDVPDEGVIFDIWQSGCSQAEFHYFTLLEKGLKPESARSVLPNCTKCEITVTANIRAWRNMFRLRTSQHAQKEIRNMCKLIHAEMLDNGVPAILFDDIFTD